MNVQQWFEPGGVQLCVTVSPRVEVLEGQGGVGQASVGLPAALLVQVELLHLLLQEAGRY